MKITKKKKKKNLLIYIHKRSKKKHVWHQTFMYCKIHRMSFEEGREQTKHRLEKCSIFFLLIILPANIKTDEQLCINTHSASSIEATSPDSLVNYIFFIYFAGILSLRSSNVVTSIIVTLSFSFEAHHCGA